MPVLVQPSKAKPSRGPAGPALAPAASVVIAQWFGVPAFPVDTHIHRLAHRWGLTRGKTVEKTEADLKKVFSRDTWNIRHLQIIFFGREYCPARGHDLTTCPICSWAASKKRIRDESMR